MVGEHHVITSHSAAGRPAACWTAQSVVTGRRADQIVTAPNDCRRAESTGPAGHVPADRTTPSRDAAERRRGVEQQERLRAAAEECRVDRREQGERRAEGHRNRSASIAR